MTHPDGTIEQTIIKQVGHGPYLFAVLWFPIEFSQYVPNVSVFSFWDTAKAFVDRIQANGHKVMGIELAVDNTQRILPRYEGQ